MKYDIRKLYDINGPHLEILAAILEGRHPRFPEDEARPGFDCLIVVLRRIYSHVMLGTTLDWLAASEKENPVLRLAWHTFDDDKEEVKDALRLRQDVLNALHPMGLDSGASFEEFCNSSLMNKTFWSQDEFRLIDTPYCMETFQKVDGSPDEFAGASLVELDRVQNPDLLLQEAVDKSFGVIAKSGKQVMCRPSHAAVVRVLYKAGVQRLDINDLRSLSVPLWEECKDSDDISFQEVGRVQYCLLAVVKVDHLRGDKVRTYGIQGSNIVAEREPREIIDHDWSVVLPGKYMLFYGQQTMRNPGDPTRFPEVQGPRISEKQCDLLKGVGEDLNSEMVSLQKSKASNPPVQRTPKATKAVEPPKVTEGQASAQSTGQAEPEESRPDRGSLKRTAPQDSQEESARKSKRSRRDKAGSSKGSSKNHGQDESERPKGSSRGHGQDDSDRPKGPSSKQHESEQRRDARRSPSRR
ncbi:uncharacterized protein FFB20_14874 [Fusarium fujikuroi]|nr:Uncharacterized protein Y057_7548 [Fusarium fujikuroi]SCO15928.1 uncharacterized protein FFB20_14874 [Fusarium fujikuroi]SCO20699.1 uncharacterized protein FFC1_13809 [Fusarium fujikuroi]SCO45504.1 uncharacterized protein FFNC_10329 [Fusarium fujikuroi]VTT83127.1 unnamed protein product [Fusarium fujikuroi]